MAGVLAQVRTGPRLEVPLELEIGPGHAHVADDSGLHIWVHVYWSLGVSKAPKWEVLCKRGQDTNSSMVLRTMKPVLLLTPKALLREMFN